MVIHSSTEKLSEHLISHPEPDNPECDSESSSNLLHADSRKVNLLRANRIEDEDFWAKSYPETMTYDASSINVLDGLEAIRRRPAMYIGSTDSRGINHLIDEVVQNAVDEILASYCDKISLCIGADGLCTVMDNGRGIPTEIHPRVQVPTAELVFTLLHSGGKFDPDTYPVSGGLHGVGLACINALSSSVTVDIWRDSRHFRQRFEQGKVMEPLHVVEQSSQTGTRIKFLPDKEIFGYDKPDLLALDRRLRDLSFLHPQTTIEFEREGRKDVFCASAGIEGLVAYRSRNRRLLHKEPIAMSGEMHGVRISCALLWTDSFDEEINSFVNSVATPRGGTHVDELRRAIHRAIAQFAADEHRISKHDIISSFDITEGLCAVISIQLRDPEFDGQTKSVLSSKVVGEIVFEFVLKELQHHLRMHPEIAQAVIHKAVAAQQARNAARTASRQTRYHWGEHNFSKKAYQIQFGIRSKNWHDSATWIAHDGLLAEHAKMCKVTTNAQVLDTCCGSGVVGNAFRGRVGKVTGLDITPEMVAIARTRLDEVKQGDVYEIPFSDQSFNLIVNREVLHLLPNPLRPVQEMHRVLRSGGQFIVGQMVPYCDLDAPWLFRILKKKQPLFCNNFTAESFVELLTQVGFVDIEMTEYQLWEDIDVWIDTHETSPLHRREIREFYTNAPREVKSCHPFEIREDGGIRDLWRWCIFSCWKPQ